MRAVEGAIFQIAAGNSDSRRGLSPGSPTGNSTGAVLLVVLWVLVAMSLLALSFSASIRTEVEATANVVDQKQAYYAARAGIEYAIYKVMETQSQIRPVPSGTVAGGDRNPAAPEDQPVTPIFSGRVTLRLADAVAEVDVADESGKINLNLAPSHLIYNLLIMVGVDPATADVITDSIDDWRDPDDFYRPNGAESDYYQSLEEPYLSKNGPFDVVEELLLVRGVTPEIYYGRKGLSENGERVAYYGLQNYFTTFTNANRINVNSAPVPVLAAIPGLDYQVALMVDEMRRQPLSDVSEILLRIPGLPTDVLSYLGVFTSNTYSLESVGRRGASQIRSRIRAVVRIDGLGAKGYTTLYWNESNLEL